MPAPVILIADDDASSRRLLSFCLQRLACTVVQATDGAEALARLRCEPVNLFITDVNMPGLDGGEIVRALRADPALRDLPVLMLTGADDERVFEEGRALGVLGFFSKPFSPTDLVSRVRQLLATSVSA